MQNEIEQKVIQIIKENLIIEGVEDINLESTFRGLRFDSMAFVKLIVVVEMEFDIEVKVEAINFERIQKLQDLVSYIQDRIAEK